MDEHSEKFNKKERKYKEVPDRSHRVEEYNNQTERYTRGFQQKTRWSRRISKLENKAPFTQTEHQNEKRTLKSFKMPSGPDGKTLSRITFALLGSLEGEEKQKASETYLKK